MAGIWSQFEVVNSSTFTSSGDLVVKRSRWTSQVKNAADRVRVEGGGRGVLKIYHHGSMREISVPPLQSYDVNSCRVQRWQVRPRERGFKLHHSFLVRSLAQVDKSRAVHIKCCCCFRARALQGEDAGCEVSVHAVSCRSDIAALQVSAEIRQTGISSQMHLIQTVLDPLVKSWPGFPVFWEKTCKNAQTVRLVRSGPRRCARSSSRLFLGNAILNVNVPLTAQVAPESRESVRSLGWNINARCFVFFVLRLFFPFQRL